MVLRKAICGSSLRNVPADVMTQQSWWSSSTVRWMEKEMALLPMTAGGHRPESPLISWSHPSHFPCRLPASSRGPLI